MPVAMPRAALLLLLLAPFLPAVAAEPGQLKLNALIQEGDLLLEEVARLEPANERFAAEGKGFDQTERDLRDASPALDADIRKYNGALAALEKGVAERQARCPKESTDNALVEWCNAQAAQLNGESQRLAGERDGLNARRSELNGRIERFNQERKEWAALRQAHEKLIGPNKTDVDYWVQRAADFIASPDFKSLYVLSSVEPGVCAPATLGDLKALHYWEALKRAHQCLRAVRAGLPE